MGTSGQGLLSQQKPYFGLLWPEAGGSFISYEDFPPNHVSVVTCHPQPHQNSLKKVELVLFCFVFANNLKAFE